MLPIKGRRLNNTLSKQAATCSPACWAKEAGAALGCLWECQRFVNAYYVLGPVPAKGSSLISRFPQGHDQNPSEQVGVRRKGELDREEESRERRERGERSRGPNSRSSLMAR